MTEPLIADAYLQVEKATFYGAGWKDTARVQRCTQNKPEVVLPGCIVVKVRLRIPAEAWGPFEPEAVIDVPAELIQHPITVTAEDPS